MKRLVLIALAVLAASAMTRASAQPMDPDRRNTAGVPVSTRAVRPALSAVLPAAPGVTYRMLLPMRLDTFNSDTQWAFQLGGRYVTGGTRAFGAQIDLPQGAQLVEATLFYIDNAAGTIDMTLYEQPPDSTTASIVASANTTDADSPTIRSISLTGAPLASIDNAQRVYYIEIGLPSATANHRVHGLRLGYKYMTTFLPFIHRE